MLQLITLPLLKPPGCRGVHLHDQKTVCMNISLLERRFSSSSAVRLRRSHIFVAREMGRCPASASALHRICFLRLSYRGSSHLVVNLSTRRMWKLLKSVAGTTCELGLVAGDRRGRYPGTVTIWSS